MKTNRFAAIDVGTTKICTVMADINEEGETRIVGVGIAPSNGMHKGLVVNINEAKRSIRESIRKAEQVAGSKVESALVGITGRQISSLNNHGAVAITRGDQLVRSDDLKRVLNVARSIKVPAERKLLHVIPRTFKVDGQEGIDNPVGMHGFRLDAETHIITAMTTSIQNLTKCIRGCGVEVDDLVLEPLASAEAVLDEEEKQDGVVLADIGGGTTDIAIFKEGTIYHTSVLPVAGYQLTRDISVGMGLSYELAEEMKKKYGNVTPSLDLGDDDSSIVSDGHNISYRDLIEIIRVRVEELLRLTVLELPQADYHKLVPSGLVLTGGGANLPGIAELGQYITRMPVRIGAPMCLDGVGDSLCDPAYATAVGLILWKAKRRDKQDISVRESGLRRFLNRIFKVFR
jgi:cell division protein FtsA